jgi:hypothetical protein
MQFEPVSATSQEAVGSGKKPTVAPLISGKYFGKKTKAARRIQTLNVL